MATWQVHVLYDFEGQAENELNISAGEFLTVTSKDAGEGWWEGVNSNGQMGLFPASYVEEIPSQPPVMPPPPLPESYVRSQEKPLSSSYPSAPQQQVEGGWDDDEWDDDEDDTASTIDQNYNNTQHSRQSYDLALPLANVQRSNSAGDVSTMGRGDTANKATIRRNFNRFTTFVKSGGEDYIIGKARPTSVATTVEVIETADHSIIWEPNRTPHTCEISSSKKESKLHGFKSYIAYQIITSISPPVSRRYKQFDWLHQRLQDKFAVIPIPPLPDKQISGRYEEAFIEHRKQMLQSWVNRITRHPVLSQSQVWMHFIACNDEKGWKSGKRTAEKDEYVGASFFYSISPLMTYSSNLAEGQIDAFGKFVKTMDEGVRVLQTVAIDQIKKHTGPYKREFQRIGHAFQTLSSAFETDKQAFSVSAHLIQAIDQTGQTYNEIGSLFEEQPKNDLEPMIDVLYEYKGMLAEYPDILTVHKGALNKTRELQKMSNDMTDVDQRMSLISLATLAEMNHFRGEMVTDYNAMMKMYLTGQIQFYENIVDKLKESLSRFQ